MARLLAYTDDVLGIATENDILLVSTSGGVRRSFVEAPGESGKYSQTYIKTVQPHEEYVNEYELRSSNLALPFGVPVNTDYFLISANVTEASNAYVRVSVTYRKFSAPGKFDADASPDVTVTVTGGFGVVDVLGVTLSGGCAQSATYSVGGELAGENTLTATTGDFCTGAIMLHRLKKTCTIETTGTISALPSGANATAPLDVRKDNTGELHITSAAWFSYLDPA